MSTARNLEARSTSVAVLYVDPRGPYPELVVDCWDETRDAREPAPPRDEGSRARRLRPDRGRPGPPLGWGARAARAIEALEVCGLPVPGALPDEHGGYSLEVAQVEWGHVARKKTWLYLVGIPLSALGRAPFPGREPTHWVSGGREHERKGSGGVIPPGIKVCSAQLRRRTPIAFARWLVELAERTSLSNSASQGKDNG